ncbi:hypothetical protein B7463_g7274, partial [Scytalidium lignicola]
MNGTMNSTVANTVTLEQSTKNILDCSTMGIDNYLGFSVRIPIGLQVITPMVTNNSLLDEFALLFSSALGSPELACKRQVIEDALTLGPLSKVSDHHIKSATRCVAMNFATHFLDDFLQKLMTKLLLDQAEAKKIQAALTNQHEAEKLKLAEELKKKHDLELKKQKEEWDREQAELKKKHDEELRLQQEAELKKKLEEEEKEKQAEAEKKRQEAEAKKKHEEEEKMKAAEAEKNRQEEEKRKQEAAALEQMKKEEAEKNKPAGSKVEDQVVLDKLKKVGKCPQGYEWVREQGGFICSGGGHHVTDAELNQA